MTHIEQAIGDAVEKGGYDFNGFYKEYGLGSPRIDFRDDGMILVGTVQAPIGAAERIIHGYKSAEIFLDLAFWQALGKARGWTEADYEKSRSAREATGYSLLNVPTWLERWHRFIDHLADGKDAESFFAILA